ncbi:hypothetical protein B7494_g7175 [Chlorociboria aeruginascens]|nr:hypothetical protein B7494_g7175 [Chlorociboria aeruginascens]
MATAGLSIRPKADAITDIGAIWKAAIVRYEEITMVKIDSLAGANSVDGVLDEIHERETKFKGYRHDGSKLDKFRSLVRKSMGPIEKLSNIIAQAALNSFPPSTAIFTAVSFLIKAANSVSADYDKIVGFFEDLDLYLNRLKILEKWVPPVPELEVALTEVLTSVLVLCAICAKYIKMKRIVKAFRNLISGEDDELSAAYTHFHKMVEQEHGAVRNATLAAVGQLQKESTSIHAVVQENLAITERTDLNMQSLMAGTEQLRSYQESREAALERENILTKLSSLDFDEYQRDAFAKHHPKTGQWLLETDEFQRWFRGNGPSILWCPGIPGAGKTVMTSFAVDYTQEAIQGSKAAIACIYCDYKNPKTHSELELLSSITRQLTKQTSSIPQEVREFCAKDAERRRNPTGDEWISLVKSICSLFQNTYVFVDALDECPEINRERFLGFVRKMEPFVRLFITSRPNVDLQAKFDNTSRIDISPSDSDISVYLKSEISTNNRLSLFTAKDAKLEEDIIKTVSEKATGIQWNIKTVRKTMDALPEGVFEFYKEAMERIERQPEEDKQLARRALSYIFCARRPLNVTELHHILAVEAEDTELDVTACPETEILLNISAGLIRIDEKSGTAGLAHYTLQEYLEKNRGKLLPNPEVEIGTACLTYLSFDIFREGPCNNEEELHHRLQEYQLLDYASHNWGYHVKENQLHERVVDLLLPFLKDEQKLSSFVQILHIDQYRTNWHYSFPKHFGPLHVIAYWGLDKIFILSEKDIDVNSQDSYGETALQLAAKHGHMSVTQLLINKGVDVNIINKNGETALYWAARNGHKVIIKLLLLNGANVLTKDNEGWTALDWAVVGGDDEVVKMLLDSGVDMNAENGGRHKALYLAADEGQNLTVQMLLESGADVNAQDWLGSSALDFAVAPGHEKAAQVLLQQGANVKSVDIYGNTALHWASPYQTLTQLLFQYGVDVNAQNDKGQTALCWAAQDGPVAVAELLLEKNADINIQDVYGFTALHRAALRGREAMVRLLLENGADPNVKDRDQWTALHVAALKQHDVLVQILLDRVDDGKAIVDWVASQLQDIKRQASLEEVVEKKAEANTVVTGLRVAIQERQLGRSQLLIDRGADVNAKDIGGWTALILAATAGHEEAVQLLLDNGADVNIGGSDQWTALHWASKRGYEAIVQLLVQKGADVNASAYGRTPILLAAENEHPSVVHFLLEHGADL